MTTRQSRLPSGAACNAFTSAARLTTWAVFYLALGIWGWPAIPIALAAGAIAIIQGRRATSNLADLIEAAADLYSHDLATNLGETGTGPSPPPWAAS